MFSVDTNCLVNCFREHYPRDVFPGVWDVLEHAVSQDVIKVHEEVYQDLSKKDDQLFAWAKARKQQLVIPNDNRYFLRVSEIMKTHGRLVKEGTGRSASDPFVIALALENGWSVVTLEKSGTDKKPKIPFVCNAYNIECIDLVQLFRKLRAKFMVAP